MLALLGAIPLAGPFLVANPWARKLLGWLLALAAVAAALALIRADGYRAGVRHEQEAEAARVAALAKKIDVAKSAAQVQATTDAAMVAGRTGELKHADDATADGRPSAARLALACERMRQQGSSDADVSRCRALAGAGQAPPLH